MISREKALKEVTVYNESRQDNIGTVNYIYDSIGRCRECEHSKKTRINDEFIYCHKLEIYKDDTFFCADFERKVD